MITATLCFCVFVVLVECAGLNHQKLLSGRRACSSYDIAPVNRVNTTEQLERLREEMQKENISAYIITENDDHQSLFLAERDKRRQYMSGFTGMSGDAVVTLTTAAVWTDSRYYLQAEQELDCNWILMRSGERDVPTIEQFIVEELQPGDEVSADPKVTTWRQWNTWETTFTQAGLHLKLHRDNLVDNIWGESEGRPPYPDVPVFILSTNFTGKTWQVKLAEIREIMAENSARVLLISALDEVAWVLNLRGGDMTHTPVFKAYLMIGLDDWATLYVSSEKLVPEIEDHLNTHRNSSGDSVTIKEYDEIWNDLPQQDVGDDKIWLADAFSFAGGASHLLHITAPEGKVMFQTSPALLMKDKKNPTEVKGMRNAHIKDAVALCQLLHKLEDEITWHPDKEQKEWDEISAATYLEQLRKEQELNLGQSFGTISAFGPNSALPHYQPTLATNRTIDNSSMYMLDSGGQYLDGTTDVTRSVHFGTPTEEHKTVYTHLLMGCINLVSTIFPEGETVPTMEILVRSPLFSLGRNYGHGSTHGIGTCLGVHEAYNNTYHEGFFGSQEPGYYEENVFGMRLENIVTVIKADVEATNNAKHLTFDPVTLVPYERKLIIPELMSNKQLAWLNDYHEEVRKVIGNELLNQGHESTYQWLIRKTEPITYKWLLARTDQISL